MTLVRLQKFLARGGIASRRKAEELIQAGRVQVNGRVVTELGTKVDDEQDDVRVDGRIVRATSPLWVALHKPRGYVSTREDPQGRPTIYELLPHELHSLFYVGRLDLNSEGLLLLTNDGDAAHRLLHPSFRVARVYDTLVTGDVAPDTLRKLRTGVELEDGVARVESVRVLPASRPGHTRLRLVLREGRKREVRRMLSAVEHEVRRLRRISYGPVKLGNLPAGKWRRLTDAELSALPAQSKRQ